MSNSHSTYAVGLYAGTVFMVEVCDSGHSQKTALCATCQVGCEMGTLREAQEVGAVGGAVLRCQGFPDLLFRCEWAPPCRALQSAFWQPPRKEALEERQNE